MEQKILIVDDEAHIRMLIEQTLEELEDDGVKFLIAENGEEALALIIKRKTAAGFPGRDDAEDEWHGSMPAGKKRTGPAGCLYCIVNSQGPGSGPDEGTGSRR